MKSRNVDHLSVQQDSANVGAYGGGGGLMCFSLETLSSCVIKRKYAEYKTEEEGGKKTPVSCTVSTFGRRSAPQSGGGLLKSPLLCLGTASPLSHLPQVRGATGYACIHIFFSLVEMAPGFDSCYLSPLQRKIERCIK